MADRPRTDDSTARLAQPAVRRWLGRLATLVAHGITPADSTLVSPTDPGERTLTALRKLRAHRTVRNAMARASRRRNRRGA